MMTLRLCAPARLESAGRSGDVEADTVTEVYDLFRRRPLAFRRCDKGSDGDMFPREGDGDNEGDGEGEGEREDEGEREGAIASG